MLTLAVPSAEICCLSYAVSGLFVFWISATPGRYFFGRTLHDAPESICILYLHNYIDFLRKINQGIDNFISTHIIIFGAELYR